MPPGLGLGLGLGLGFGLRVRARARVRVRAGVRVRVRLADAALDLDLGLASLVAVALGPCCAGPSLWCSCPWLPKKLEAREGPRRPAAVAPGCERSLCSSWAMSWLGLGLGLGSPG